MNGNISKIINLPVFSCPYHVRVYRWENSYRTQTCPLKAKIKDTEVVRAHSYLLGRGYLYFKYMNWHKK